MAVRLSWTPRRRGAPGSLLTYRRRQGRLAKIRSWLSGRVDGGGEGARSARGGQGGWRVPKSPKWEPEAEGRWPEPEPVAGAGGRWSVAGTGAGAGAGARTGPGESARGGRMPERGGAILAMPAETEIPRWDFFRQ
jgi:hypothetical protein